MDYTEYLRELEEYIGVLPTEIKQAAIEFYRKMFEEAGDAGEMGILLRLGSAYALAKNIIAEKSDYTDTDEYRALKKDFPDYGFPAEKTEPEPEIAEEPAPLPEIDIKPQFQPQPKTYPQPQQQPYPQPQQQPYSQSQQQPYHQQQYNPQPQFRTQPQPQYDPRYRSANAKSYTPPPASKFGDPPRFDVRDTAPPRAMEKQRNQRNTAIGVFIAIFVFIFGIFGIISMLFGLAGTSIYNHSEAFAVTEMPAPPAIEFAVPDVPDAPEMIIPGAPMSQYIFSGEVSQFSVYATGANVEIVYDSEFKVVSDSENAEPGNFDVDFTDGVLSVSAFAEAGNVTIHIPNHIMGNVYVSSDGGSVSIQNISASTMEIYGTDASFELIDNTIWNKTSIFTTDCDYYGSNNTFNGELNVDGYDSE
jgi:hypothetical protein